MMYLQLQNIEQAQAVNRKMYEISRPDPDPDDVTKELGVIYPHPTESTVLVEILDADDWFIAANADSKIDEYINLFDNAQLNPTQKNTLRRALRDNRGLGVRQSRLLHRDQVTLTREQAEALGYVIVPEDPPEEI